MPKITRKMPIIFLAGFLLMVITGGCRQESPDGNDHSTENRRQISQNEFDARSLESLTRIENTKMFTMTYYSDYKLEKIRAHGIQFNADEPALEQLHRELTQNLKALKNSQSASADHCTSIFVETGSDTYHARNFDWDNDAFLVIKTEPGNGYASVGVVDLLYLGIEPGDIPEKSDEALLLAPYAVLGGMNDQGLAISEMSVDDQYRPEINPDLPSVNATLIIRLVLDYAANVQEAIQIFREYNIIFDIEVLHYLVTDKEGNSALIEFIDGRLQVTHAGKDYQIGMNDIAYGRTEDNLRQNRVYSKALDFLKNRKTPFDTPSAVELMNHVSVEWTMWTSIYNLDTLEYRIIYRNDNGHALTGSLNRPGSE